MIYLMRNSKAGTIFEFVVSFAIIFVLIGLFGIYAFRVVEEARLAALRNELSSLRVSLEIYRIFNESNPDDLRELYSVKEYFAAIGRLDEEGRLRDPFGNSYSYDPKRGAIRTTTARFKDL